MAATVADFAFVDIDAASGSDGVAFKARMTFAFARARRVGTIGVFVAAAVILKTLIDIYATVAGDRVVAEER